MNGWGWLALGLTWIVGIIWVYGIMSWIDRVEFRVRKLEPKDQSFEQLP